MKLKKILALSLALLLVLTPIANAKSEIKKYIAYGSGVIAKEQADLSLLFEEEVSDETDYVTPEDYNKYLGGNISASSLISSVAVSFTDNSNEVNVKILTPDKITKISEQQYINAAITSGIYSADILVASPREVTGKSALSGVFKAAEKAGLFVDPQLAQLGQEEMDVTAEVIESNKENEEFDEEKFNEAITIIKAEIAKQAQENNNEVSVEKTNTIINNIFKEYNIKIDNSDKEKITEYVNKFSSSMDKIDTEKLVKNLSSFSEKAFDKTIDIIHKAQDENWLDKINNFVDKLIQAIVDLFS